MSDFSNNSNIFWNFIQDNINMIIPFEIIRNNYSKELSTVMFN